MLNKLKNSLFSEYIDIFSLMPKKLRIQAFSVFFFMVLQALSELFFILSITFLGMAFTAPEVLRASFPFRLLLESSDSIATWGATTNNLFLLSGFLIIFSSLLKNAFTAISVWLTSIFGQSVSIAFGKDILSRFLYQDYAWHLSAESGTTFQRMMWRDHLANLLTYILSMLTCIITLVILLINFVGREPVLSILVIGATCLSGILIYNTLRSTVDYYAQKVAVYTEKETKALLCATKGIQDVLIYHKQQTFLGTFVDTTQAAKRPRTFCSLAPSIPVWLLEIVGFSMMIIAIAYLVFWEKADTPRIIDAISLLIVTCWRALPYANRVVGFKIAARSIRPMCNAVITLLKELKKLPTVIPSCPGNTKLSFKKDIVFENVSFCYPSSSKLSLDSINLIIPAGSKTGIIGSSGSGKSTFAGILCGLLPPSSGFVRIDGTILNRQSAAEYSSIIGYVPQTPFLFEGTLEENIAFKDWGSKPNEALVKKACIGASIDFVDNHPLGLQQMIGENGKGLSGGQAQRVALARALYSEPKLLIFDEATSSLDKFNEQAIQKTIYELSEDVTSIVIAHRLETVEQCDRLIWIEKGKIKKIGTPKDILSEYRALVRPEEEKD